MNVLAQAQVGKCPLCDASDVRSVSVAQPLFRHLDFGPIDPGPGFLGICPRCKLVFREAKEATLIEMDAIFQTCEYAECEEAHSIVTEGYDDPVTREFLQAQILQEYLPERDGAILDIGCSDGSLLREFLNRCESRDLCGFDIGERPQFQEGPGVRMVVGTLDQVDGEFDLVVMSHAIQYVRDIGGLFTQVRRLLKPDGVFFVQVPNFSLKPCSLLMGDLYYHYTPNILGNVFRHFRFSCTPVDNSWFPRDILATGQPNGDAREVLYEDDRQVYSTLEYINGMVLKLRTLSNRESIGLLGTTIEAAFAAHCLGSQVGYFVDENPVKMGTTFYGKAVLHPRSVAKDDLIVIPLGQTAEKIQRRLAKEYEGRYVCA